MKQRFYNRKSQFVWYNVSHKSVKKCNCHKKNVTSDLFLYPEINGTSYDTYFKDQTVEYSAVYSKNRFDCLCNS